MKKLKIEKTKPTFIVKTFKVVYQGCIVYSNSNFFINKIIMQIIGVSFSSSNSALVIFNKTDVEVRSLRSTGCTSNY